MCSGNGQAKVRAEGAAGAGRRSRRWLLGAAGVAVAAVLATDNPVRREIVARLSTGTVESRVARFGERVDSLWVRRCRDVGAAYPPPLVTVVVFKKQLGLWVYVARGEGRWGLAATYPVLAASGGVGPKLREGDGQVPEGVYRVVALNPNSRYHAALRLDYPSDEDRRIGAAEGRAELGGDIMIHGSDVSVGCVAMGDEAIEELFVLAARVGIERVEVLMCPSTEPEQEIGAGTPGWVAERYRRLTERLKALDAR
jgi:hypothetical protein